MADLSGAPSDSFVTLLTPAQPGDYNADGHVDGNDYALWRNTFGSISVLDADGNNNNVVDAPDYVLWRKNVPSATNSVWNAVRSVPEPPTTTAAIEAMVFILAILWRERVSIFGQCRATL